MLLDDIIGILSDEADSLNSALLKTKVLLHNIGKKDLAAWVNHELQGYPDDESVPEYRKIKAEVHGHVSSWTWQMADTKLPIMHLSKKEQDSLTSMSCTMSISSVEEAIRAYRKSGSGLIAPLPPEFGAVKFKKAVQPGVNVISSWCELNMIQVEGVLTEVRSRLLDFMLELRGVVGINTPEADVVAKVQDVDTEKMFGTAIYGSGHIINIGHQNVQVVNNEKDDLEGLIATVGQLGFQQQMLDDLRHAIGQDKAKGNAPDVVEGSTSEWFKKALKESGKGVVKAGVDVVSTVIVKAIKAYTGMP